MQYLNVPNTNIKLRDGTIVVLDRFPGTRWITHYGWYTFKGKSYMGWYFCSVPAQMIMPVNAFDLKLLSVVSDNKNSRSTPCEVMPPDVMPPGPPGCPPDGMNPIPHMQPGSYLPGDAPPFPPHCVEPLPHVKPAIFTNKQAMELDSAFISVPNLKHRDRLDTRITPDGKIVRVNSVNGKVKYYQWSKYNDTWEELPELATLDEFHEAIEDIRDSIEVLDDKVDENAQIAEDALNEYKGQTDADLASIHEDISEDRERMDGMQQQIDDLSQKEDEDHQELSDRITVCEERLDTVEDTLFDVKRVFELSGDNTVVVVNNKTIANSGVAIGDDEIGEPWEYADDKTLATEKAVAKKADSVITRWSAF